MAVISSAECPSAGKSFPGDAPRRTLRGLEQGPGRTGVPMERVIPAEAGEEPRSTQHISMEWDLFPNLCLSDLPQIPQSRRDPHRQNPSPCSKLHPCFPGKNTLQEISQKEQSYRIGRTRPNPWLCKLELAEFLTLQLWDRDSTLKFHIQLCQSSG